MKKLGIGLLTSICLLLTIILCLTSCNGDKPEMERLEFSEYDQTFSIGNEPNISTGKLYVVMTDGTKNEVSLSEATVSTLDTSTTGEKTATITYNGLSLSFTYSVIDPELATKHINNRFILISEWMASNGFNYNDLVTMLDEIRNSISIAKTQEEIDRLVATYDTASFDILFREAWAYIEKASVDHRDVGALYMSMLVSPTITNTQDFDAVIHTVDSFRTAITSAENEKILNAKLNEARTSIETSRVLLNSDRFIRDAEKESFNLFLNVVKEMLNTIETQEDLDDLSDALEEGCNNLNNIFDLIYLKYVDIGTVRYTKECEKKIQDVRDLLAELTTMDIDEDEARANLEEYFRRTPNNEKVNLIELIENVLKEYSDLENAYNAANHIREAIDEIEINIYSEQYLKSIYYNILDWAYRHDLYMDLSLDPSYNEKYDTYDYIFKDYVIEDLITNFDLLVEKWDAYLALTEERDAALKEILDMIDELDGAIIYGGDKDSGDELALISEKLQTFLSDERFDAMNNYDEYFVYGHYDYPVLLDEMLAQYESLKVEAESILKSLGRLPNTLPKDTADYFEKHYAEDAVTLKNIADAIATFKGNNCGNIDIIEASEDYAHYLEYLEQWKTYQ